MDSLDMSCSPECSTIGILERDNSIGHVCRALQNVLIGLLERDSSVNKAHVVLSIIGVLERDSLLSLKCSSLNQ